MSWNSRDKAFMNDDLQVAEIIVHPDFNSIDLRQDIAMIKLSSEVPFNNYVQPVNLWKSSETDISEVVGKSGTVIRWELKEMGEVSNVLRQVSINVVSSYTCLRSNPDVFKRKKSKTNFCAGLLNGMIN